MTANNDYVPPFNPRIVGLSIVRALASKKMLAYLSFNPRIVGLSIVSRRLSNKWVAWFCFQSPYSGVIYCKFYFSVEGRAI